MESTPSLPLGSAGRRDLARGVLASVGLLWIATLSAGCNQIFGITPTTLAPPDAYTCGCTCAAPATLGPPNHTMVPVTVTTAAADGCGAATCTIASVTSNEPVNGGGDGNTGTDWQITGPNTVDLRAERSGTGSGRV
jgi:hypothetical protein